MRSKRVRGVSFVDIIFAFSPVPSKQKTFFWFPLYLRQVVWRGASRRQRGQPFAFFNISFLLLLFSDRAYTQSLKWTRPFFAFDQGLFTCLLFLFAVLCRVYIRFAGKCRV